MPGAIKTFLKDVAGGFFGNDYLRDYTHASKTFKPGFYANAPKFKFLFHVYFEINPEAQPRTSQTNFGLLVKSVKLPNFSFDTHQLNQYNRKRIVQTKIKYDPIDIQFHDDNDDSIANLWYKYYTYYYKDGTKPKVVFKGNRGGAPASDIVGGGNSATATLANYNERTTYLDSITGGDDWGYIGETGDPTKGKATFFKNITIFGFNQHNFLAYTLINPIITRFGHDTYDYAEAAGTMTNSMTLDYETVVYNRGNMDGQKSSDIVTGFGLEANYDKRLSPIATPGSNSNVLGPTGLIASAGGAIKDMAEGNLLTGIRTAGAAYNSAKNINLKATLSAELKQGIQNALQGATNNTRSKNFDIPTYGATASTQGTAGTPPVARSAPQDVGTINTAGQQNNINGLDLDTTNPQDNINGLDI